LYLSLRLPLQAPQSPQRGALPSRLCWPGSSDSEDVRPGRFVGSWETHARMVPETLRAILRWCLERKMGPWGRQEVKSLAFSEDCALTPKSHDRSLNWSAQNERSFA